ncbi:MAG: acyltransferase [Acetobacteraceae bacterium]|jgi:fucose 4-O-acetylase-like acetyltransferase|nr:acyltransferase [Acetobacteraceae bacterium]
MAARRLDIDTAKGIAILLVVFGHIVARESPADNAWYDYARAAVYRFHMPFFMYLSGYVVGYLALGAVTREAYPRFLRSRAVRLLVPFFAFGLLVLAGKMVAAHVIHVDNRPSGVLDGLIDLFWTTRQSPSGSVWFMFCLFLFLALTPPLGWLRAGFWPHLALGLVVFATGLPDRLYLNKAAEVAAYFALGALVGERAERCDAPLARLGPLLLIPFAALLVGYEFVPRTWREPVAVATALVSIPAIHGTVLALYGQRRNVWTFFGRYTFAIYLLNTIAIGVTKGVMLRVMPWDGPNFLLFAPALMAAGTVGPIIAKLTVFRLHPALDRMTD